MALRKFVLYLSVTLDKVDASGDSEPRRYPNANEAQEAVNAALALFNTSDSQPDTVQFEAWTLSTPVPVEVTHDPQ